MDDLISRQAAIDSLDTGSWGVKWDKALATAILEDLPPAQPEQQWIPCGERLPEYGCPVLWCNENGSVFVSAITVKTDHGWAIGKRHRMCEVIAWMPLPEPYQGEGEEE